MSGAEGVRRVTARLAGNIREVGHLNRLAAGAAAVAVPGAIIEIAPGEILGVDGIERVRIRVVAGDFAGLGHRLRNTERLAGRSGRIDAVPQEARAVGDLAVETVVLGIETIVVAAAPTGVELVEAGDDVSGETGAAPVRPPENRG